MNNFNKALITLVTGVLLSASATAAVNSNMGKAYVGVKGGQFDIDLDKNEGDLDNPIAYGLYGGYEIDSNIGVELEYLRSTNTDITVNNVTSDSNNARTLSAYSTYKYGIPNSGLYAKGKLGFAKTEVELTNVYNKQKSRTLEESGVSGGIGLGLNVNPNFAIEGEYTRLPSVDNKDVDLMTIGAHLKF